MLENDDFVIRLLIFIWYTSATFVDCPGYVDGYEGDLFSDIFHYEMYRILT